jgi:hypothetical protein
MQAPYRVRPPMNATLNTGSAEEHAISKPTLVTEGLNAMRRETAESHGVNVNSAAPIVDEFHPANSTCFQGAIPMKRTLINWRAAPARPAGTIASRIAAASARPVNLVVCL